MENEKKRLDVLLVEKAIFTSRERARENVEKGNILVDGKKVDKCSKKIDINSKIEFIGEKLPYVSRGGLKLEKAIDLFNINLKQKVCLDIGASTGGFTDCMLQNGAKLVYAIDVGTNQLHDSLRSNPKVISMEKTNVKDVKLKDLEEYGSFASIDVSFISLTKVLPTVINLLDNCGEVMALIKPQFEAGKGNVNKQGVVKNIKIHKNILNTLIEFFKEHNLNIKGFTFSPIKGPNGNIEYLVYLSKDNNEEDIFNKFIIEDVIDEAFRSLN